MGEVPSTMGDLPAGTVTLLLADVEGSTRLWETEPDAMRAALLRLSALVDRLAADHGGARPVEQGEGDSFVLAFRRAADAVGCALALQSARIEPVRLRIGVHTGDVELRGEGNYAGPAVNRCARLRDTAHGGQTVMSQATADIVVDRLGDGVPLVDLGVHRLKDLARPERIFQLGAGDHPPLRSLDAYTHNLPVQLTSFIGREREIADVVTALASNRLVTITGSGGCGKTRLALQVAAEVLGEYPDGVFEVDLAPLTDPGGVSTAFAAAAGIGDEPGVPTVETLARRLARRQVLVVLDNCEHLIDACAVLADRILHACPGVAFLATSREPLGVHGELTWRLPSLPPPTSVELFVERAARARSGFRLADDNRDAIEEICRRLDGVPLAIELAAARTRALRPDQIAAGLNDRFRLLSGASRTAVQRQQTLRASIDWSHGLLTEPDRVLFRRLAVFAGSFDFDAAASVGAGEGLAAHQVVDQLTSLVDKSLVNVDDDGRYRMLETVRQYAADHLSDAGEADAARRRHRDHYVSLCVAAYEHIRSQEQRSLVEGLSREIDNIRAASDWSMDVGEVDDALRLVLPLSYVWRFLGHWREPREWLETIVQKATSVPVELRFEALNEVLRWHALAFYGKSPERAEEVLALAREIGTPTAMARALRSAGYAFIWTDPNRALPLYREALELARSAGDDWTACDSLGYLAYGTLLAGSPVDALPLIDEVLELADRIGHATRANMAAGERTIVLTVLGRLHEARAAYDDARTRMRDTGDQLMAAAIHGFGAWTLALQGDVDAALALAGVEAASEIFPFMQMQDLQLQAATLLVAGRVDDAREMFRKAWQSSLFGGNSWTNGEESTVISAVGFAAFLLPRAAEAELVAGDIAAARRWLEHASSRFAGPWTRAWNTFVEARISAAGDDPARAEELAHDALVTFRELDDRLGVVDALELLATLALQQESAHESARLLAAATTAREAIGYAPLRVYTDARAERMAALRGMLGDEFDASWAEGAALSVDDAIAYARRGRGERKRPSSGWASLTPSELDVARLVGDGLSNKDIAARLFVSPRTVQAHLSHIFPKLGITSRVQLATMATANQQEATTR